MSKCTISRFENSPFVSDRTGVAVAGAGAGAGAGAAAAKTASASALIAAVPHSRKIRGRAATDAIENKGDIRSIVVPELPQPGHAAVPLCVELIALEQVVVQCARRGPHVVHRSDAMEPHPALEAAEPAFDYAERAWGGGGMGKGGR